MTDSHAGYVVVLASDIREDDAAATISALRQIKGVIAVEPVTVSLESRLAEIREKLYRFSREELR